MTDLIAATAIAASSWCAAYVTALVVLGRWLP